MDKENVVMCMCVCGSVTCSSRVQLFVTPWTVARQAPLSTGFPRQEYWRGLPFPPPGDLPDPGINPTSPALAGRFFTTEPPGKPFEKLPVEKHASLYLLLLKYEIYQNSVFNKAGHNVIYLGDNTHQNFCAGLEYSGH